jgi:hypothetical protein
VHTIQIDREKERGGWLLGLGQIKCIQIGNKHTTGVKKKKDCRRPSPTAVGVSTRKKGTMGEM